MNISAEVTHLTHQR